MSNMEASVVSSIAMPEIRARIATQRGDHAVSTSDLVNELGPSERDAAACSVRYSGVEPVGMQQSTNNGYNCLLNGGMRGNSIISVEQIIDSFIDEESTTTNWMGSDSTEISRSGSWPSLFLDNFENLFDCTLNITNIRRPLEPKESGPIAQQRTSRFVEAVSRTLSRRSRRQSPSRAAEITNVSKDKNGHHWMKLIKGLRLKRWNETLVTTIKREPSIDTPEKEAKHSHMVVGSVRDSSVTREVDVQVKRPEEKSFRSLNTSKQYARFRPRSIVRRGKHRALTPISRLSGEFTSAATARKGHRNGKDAINYGLIRIRETGEYRQVYDCVEKETGRKLSVKLIPKDHLAAALYEQLCADQHANFVRVVQILEDKRLLYILMDFNDAQYLRDLYHNSHSRTFSDQVLKCIVKDILVALSYLHRKGMVHGGVDMDSVTIHKQKNGKIKAKLATVDTVYTTKCRAQQKPQDRTFKAPELCDGTLTCSSDMWSIGILIYVLTEGRPPYKRPIPNGDARLPVPKSSSELIFTSERWMKSPGMRDFCLRCLQPDHNRRIASAMEGLIHHWFR